MHQRSELSHGYSRDIYHGRGGPGGSYGTHDYGYDAGNYYPERHPPREGSYEYGPGGTFGTPYDGPPFEYEGPRTRTTTDLQGLGVRRNVEEPFRGPGPDRSWRPGRTGERLSGFPSGGGTYEEVRSSTWDVPGPNAGHGPKGYQRSDERIHEDVCERLTAHGRLDARKIELTVENGEVTLEGTVDDRGAKRLAEDLAISVSGVEDVHNRLRLERHARSEAEEASEAAH
jgi:hypothetical protein